MGSGGDGAGGFKKQLYQIKLFLGAGGNGGDGSSFLWGLVGRVVMGLGFWW